MDTSWRFLAAEIRMPAKLFRLNLEYLASSISAPVAGGIGHGEMIALRHNLRRVRDQLNHSQIRIAISQGAFLTTWQMFEFALRSMAAEIGFALTQSEWERKLGLALPDFFLRKLNEALGDADFSVKALRQSDWAEVNRIRVLRNAITHEGGMLGVNDRRLGAKERKFIRPLADSQLETGGVFGPIEFPAESLARYADTLACPVEEIGQYLELDQCSS